MTLGARALATAAAVLACAATSAGGDDPAALSGDLLLARIKTVFRSYPRPRFVTYTLTRRDLHNGLPDLENSYTLKVWCRISDRSALVRKAWRGVAYGALQNVTVMFDREVDPGPPTADMFERRLFGAGNALAGVAPAPTRSAPADPVAPETSLPEIGRVTALDGDYRVDRVARDGALLHLWLEPKTDAERNRLDELWVDAQTYDIRRAMMRDHLYLGMGGQALDDEFDVRFRPGPGGLPLIASIHGQTKYGQYETDYRFEDIAFPDALPDWYFAPQLYGLHRAEAPS